MKFLKRTATVCIALLMAFGLTACNNSSGNEQDGENPGFGMPGETDEPFDTPISKFE